MSLPGKKSCPFRIKHHHLAEYEPSDYWTQNYNESNTLSLTQCLSVMSSIIHIVEFPQNISESDWFPTYMLCFFHVLASYIVRLHSTLFADGVTEKSCPVSPPCILVSLSLASFWSDYLFACPKSCCLALAYGEDYKTHWIFLRVLHFTGSIALEISIKKICVCAAARFAQLHNFDSSDLEVLEHSCHLNIDAALLPNVRIDYF